MAHARWTEEETKRALWLYFQLPFGQFHQKNPEVIRLSTALGRTPSSIAMKLSNFASLDPKIRESGRKGLDGASALDRTVWDLFHQDWTKLIVESAPHQEETDQLESAKQTVKDARLPFNYTSPSGESTKRVEIEQRVGQSFFRRAVMANFDNTCCVTGIRVARLLTASHISPWNEDVANRHNPRNGLSLSATFDRAFDSYLMTITPDLRVKFSATMLGHPDDCTRSFFREFEGQSVKQPTHVMPDLTLLELHSQKLLP